MSQFAPTMREIVIDETTGLDPLDGHRVVGIGAVELINRSPTGQTFHRYLCPERAMPADALAVHGLSAEFLADKPLFDAAADEFLAFVSDSPLVAHNAGFDIAFLNAERKRVAKPVIATERVIDTLGAARCKAVKHSGNRQGAAQAVAAARDCRGSHGAPGVRGRPSAATRFGLTTLLLGVSQREKRATFTSAPFSCDSVVDPLIV